MGTYVRACAAGAMSSDNATVDEYDPGAPTAVDRVLAAQCAVKNRAAMELGIDISGEDIMGALMSIVPDSRPPPPPSSRNRPLPKEEGSYQGIIDAAHAAAGENQDRTLRHLLEAEEELAKSEAGRALSKKVQQHAQESGALIEVLQGQVPAENLPGLSRSSKAMLHPIGVTMFITAILKTWMPVNWEDLSGRINQKNSGFFREVPTPYTPEEITFPTTPNGVKDYFGGAFLGLIAGLDSIRRSGTRTLMFHVAQIWDRIVNAACESRVAWIPALCKESGYTLADVVATATQNADHAPFAQDPYRFVHDMVVIGIAWVMWLLYNYHSDTLVPPMYWAVRGLVNRVFQHDHAVLALKLRLRSDDFDSTSPTAFKDLLDAFVPARTCGPDRRYRRDRRRGDRHDRHDRHDRRHQSDSRGAGCSVTRSKEPDSWVPQTE